MTSFSPLALQLWPREHRASAALTLVNLVLQVLFSTPGHIDEMVASALLKKPASKDMSFTPVQKQVKAGFFPRVGR